MDLVIDRRSLLVGAGLLAVAACSGGPPRSAEKGDDVQTIRYGDDASQFLELSRPAGTSRGVVVVIHGGFWSAQYDLSLGRPLAESLVQEGWTAANLEYRRVGNGGGWPATFDDVSAGIDALADTDVDTSTLITLGHSAGGHLAVWAAGRQRLDRWADARLPVTAAVPQAGVIDLRGSIRRDLGGGAVQSLMGDALDAHLDDADPLAAVPLDVPVRCVHGTSDSTVPIEQSETYVAAATKAGADATLTRVDGDHFVVIDPSTPAWTSTLEILEDL